MKEKNIYVAGILSGKGEAWFDDFLLTIDGIEIQNVKEVVKPIVKADLDTEFDYGSNIELNNLTDSQLNNLELLGKVWGFLKYHHPAIAKGNYNWDYELFRFLPRYLETAKTAERDALLIKWMESLGDVEKCSSCKKAQGDAILKPDLEWIKKQDEKLRNALLYLYENRSQGEHHYVEMAPNVGNPIFKNEDGYYVMTYPDDGVRLLSLYRYWNIIHYFFPYKNLMDEDWNSKLKQYIPLFIDAENELEYELAAVRMVGEICDTHANVYAGIAHVEAWKGKYYPNVHLRFIENQLVVTDFYNDELKDETPLEIGDVITKIKEVPIDNIIEDKRKYYPASNTPTRLRNMANDLLRSNSKSITITKKGIDQQEKTVTIKLYPKDSLNIYLWYPPRSGKSFEMLENNIGYVSLQNIQEEDIPKSKKEFIDTKGIIIDIRNYPSTFVPFSLGSFFVSKPTPFVKFTKANFNNPGEFNFTEDLELYSEGETYKGKLIVLVNELSQSQAEYTSMAFRAGENTTIIGSTTAGADGNVSIIMLPGGLRTMISGIGVNYPDGGETQRIGIVPDIEVHPTIKGIRQGKDELLEKAIEIINE